MHFSATVLPEPINEIQQTIMKCAKSTNKAIIKEEFLQNEFNNLKIILRAYSSTMHSLLLDIHLPNFHTMQN